MSRSIKDKIKYILETYEDARNSDKKCIELFIRNFHTDKVINGEYLLLSDITDLTNTETIRRTRQKIQEEAKVTCDERYLAKETVDKVRQQMAENLRTTMHNDNWHYNLP